MSDNQPKTSEDILGMSDEDFAKLDLNALSAETSMQTVVETKQELPNEALNAPADGSNPEGTDPSEGEGDGVPATNTDPIGDGQGEEFPTEKADQVDQNGVPKADLPKETPAESVGNNSQVKADDFVKLVTAPFKANGVEMQITDPNEIVSLMQKGLNYTAKMQSLAEPRRLHKMLSDAGIADEAKLAFLIDVNNKKPEAIAKLVRDSGVDLYQIDDEKINQYTPISTAPSSNAIVLEDVIAELQTVPEGQRAVDIVGTQWDEQSCRAVALNPKLLKDLAEHVRSGVFDRVNQVVQTERAKGNLGQLTDIDAFWQVGESMHKQGLLNDLNKPRATVPNNAPKPLDKSAEERRQQAAPPAVRRTSTTVAPVDNYLGMSDEEFADKLAKGIIKL